MEKGAEVPKEIKGRLDLVVHICLYTRQKVICMSADILKQKLINSPVYVAYFSIWFSFVVYCLALLYMA